MEGVDVGAVELNSGNAMDWRLGVNVAPVLSPVVVVEVDVEVELPVAPLLDGGANSMGLVCSCVNGARSNP